MIRVRACTRLSSSRRPISTVASLLARLEWGEAADTCPASVTRFSVWSGWSWTRSGAYSARRTAFSMTSGLRQAERSGSRFDSKSSDWLTSLSAERTRRNLRRGISTRRRHQPEEAATRGASGLTLRRRLLHLLGLRRLAQLADIGLHACFSLPLALPRSSGKRKAGRARGAEWSRGHRRENGCAPPAALEEVENVDLDVSVEAVRAVFT